MSDVLFSERQLQFLARPRIGRLGTIRRDGTPHIAPVWYRFEGGAFLVLTERGSQKCKNIERDPRVEFCIDDDQPPYHSVVVRGRAVFEDAPGADWREALAIWYLGEDAGRICTTTTSCCASCRRRCLAGEVACCRWRSSWRGSICGRQRRCAVGTPALAAAPALPLFGSSASRAAHVLDWRTTL